MNKPAVQKFNLRLPMDLMEQAQAQAEAMGISLNAYIILALREFVPATARRLRTHQPVVIEAAQAARPGPVKVGRNKLCPCGSGRKAKHCHPENC